MVRFVRSPYLISFLLTILLSSCSKFYNEISVDKFNSQEELSLFNPNAITSSQLQMTDIDNTSFEVEVSYVGDANSNASLNLYYCNETLNPGCNPILIGSTQSMINGGSSFFAEVTSLSGPAYNIGDFINITVVTEDIDGVNSGAQLSFTFRLMKIKNIFRSVGPGSTSSLASGTGNNLTISEGIASFSVALPDNIGVGDVIQFDSSGDGSIDAVIFISERNSATEYIVKTANGEEPNDLNTPDQDWDIFRAYTSLANAENGVENTGIDDGFENFDSWTGGKNLVSAVEKWHITCYDDAPDIGGNVTFDGWTTNNLNNIVVFTPYLSSHVGVSQRHDGTLHGKGYTLESSQLRIADVDANIEGLKITHYGTSWVALYAWPNTTNTQTVSFVGNFVYSNYDQSNAKAIATTGNAANATYNIINNIAIIGNQYNSSAAIYFNHNDTSTAYVYNNTAIAKAGRGILRNYGNLVVKNNLAYSELQGDFVDWGGGGSVSVSEGNISLDGTAQMWGVNSNKINETVLFNNPELWDYRLHGQSFSAIGTGLDLSNDSNFPFNNDVLGNTRARWDRGASTAPTAIFRSVGYGSTVSLQNGAGNDLSIQLNSDGHSVANFANPILDNIGVGDVIQFDADNTGGVDSLAFISFRIDSQNYIVKNAQGENADVTSTNSQSWDIFRSFTSLQNADDGIENIGIDNGLENFDTWINGKDIQTSNEQWNVALYADLAHTQEVSLEDWVTNDLNIYKLYAPKELYEVGVSQRHAGVWDNTKSFLTSDSYFQVISPNISHFILEGLQVDNSDTYTGTGHPAAGIGVPNYAGNRVSFGVVRNNIVRKTNGHWNDHGGGGYGIYVLPDNQADGKLFIVNNLVYGFDRGISLTSSNITESFLGVAYNNTIGVEAASNAISLTAYGPNDSFYIKNNILFSGVYNLESTADYIETASNLSINSSSPDGSNFQNQSPVFIEESNNDYRLSTRDDTSKGVGENLIGDRVYAFEKDIYGNSQEYQDSWDIGAFAYYDYYSLLTRFDDIGEGTAGSPYQLYNRAQIHTISSDTTLGCNSSTNAACAAYFDINVDVNMNNEAFIPIGDSSNNFTGTISAYDNELSNLSINLPTTDNVGFVGAGCPTINDLDIVSSNIVGQNDVGIFIGEVTCGGTEINGSSIKRSTVSGNENVASFMGQGYGQIDSSFAEAIVIATVRNAGGMVGFGCPAILSSHFIGEVESGTGSAGGLLAWGSNCTVTIADSYSKGKVRSFYTGTDRGAGGLVGYIHTSASSIDNSFSLSDIYSAGGGVGGAVGITNTTSTITNSWAAGDIVADGDLVGGFIGDNNANISDSFAMGKVVSDGARIGGFVGEHNSGVTITRSYALGDVYSEGAGQHAGGFVGYVTGDIDYSYAKGNVYSSLQYVGGFAGAGFNPGTVNNSYATGNVWGNIGAGGFVGNINTGTTWDSNYATGNTHGLDQTGGFAGATAGAGATITNSFATGEARGGASYTGGFVGVHAAGNISYSYALGTVSGSATANAFAGDWTGGTLDYNYWNSDTSGVVNGVEGSPGIVNRFEPYTTTEFRDDLNFDSGQSGTFNFVSDWTQLDGREEPILKYTAEAQCIDNISATTYSAIGIGTNADPFILCNYEQWYDMAINACGSGGTTDCDKIFKLGANIDFKGSFVRVSEDFIGTLDGNHKTIKNIFYDQINAGQALFASLYGTIKNLNGKNIDMNTASLNTSGLVASNFSGKLLNINLNVNIAGESHTAGLVAREYSPEGTYSVYSHISLAGSISGRDTLGGIVGGGVYNSPYSGLYNSVSSSVNITATDSIIGGIVGNGGAKISKSKSTGSITTPGGVIGGIVGQGYGADIFVRESKSSIDITSTADGDRLAGIFPDGSNVGRRSEVHNSYVYANTINGGDSDQSGGVIGVRVNVFNSYADNIFISTGSSIGGISGGGSGSGNFWNIDNGVPDGRGGGGGSEVGLFESLTNATIDDSANFIGVGWDTSDIWLLADNVRAPELRWDLHYKCQLNPTAVTYDAIGGGNRNDPYLICFKEQLVDLSVNGCDGDSNGGCSDHYLLMNDLDLKGVTMPMIGGSYVNLFSGTFNGGGNTISNFSSADGIFQMVSGTIKNLKMENASILATNSNTGILVNHLNNGVIDNCDIKGSLDAGGFGTIGGLVGLAEGTSSEIKNSYAQIDIINNSYTNGVLVGSFEEGVISNSHASGSIIGSGGNTGGLVGALLLGGQVFNSSANVNLDLENGNANGGFIGFMNSAVEVHNSYAIGRVNHHTAGDNTGGFVGHLEEGIITNSFSRGEVDGNFDTGGFVGEMNHASALIEDCYSSAPSVTSANGAGAQGAFIGNRSLGTMINNYWDNTLVADTDSAGEYEGLATSDMDNSTNFSGWNTASIWRFPTGSYPEIIPLSK